MEYIASLFSTTHAHNITPRLFIGDYYSSIDTEFIKKNNITVIVNCTKDYPFIFEQLDKEELSELPTIDFYRVPVNDSLKEEDFSNMEDYLPYIISFLHRKHQTDKASVLVHCAAGKQRSCCVVVAYLFSLCKPLPEDREACMKRVIQFVNRRRPQAFSYGMRVNFKPSLYRFFGLKPF